MTIIADAYSSPHPPAMRGVLGAVSAAHPLAVAAGQELLFAGGSAADAAIAAQAMLCVVSPDACGLGGDMLALVRRRGEAPEAINGAGRTPRRATTIGVDGANSVTVPGIVGAWAELSRRHGRLSLGRALEPAVRVATRGFAAGASLVGAGTRQRLRLERGGAATWGLMKLRAGQRFVQPELANLLVAIGCRGADAFYSGPMAEAIVSALQGQGGAMTQEDLSEHETSCRAPLVTRFGDVLVATQPPMAQGVLLSMALAALDRLGNLPSARTDHASVELTEAAFVHRARAGEGEALLEEPLSFDPGRAQNRGGPRAYLHTAGVAAIDADGLSISSLVSVFDDFGSCVYVPAGGFTLNNRAGSFTEPPNQGGPHALPVHTLAPALVMAGDDTFALATPGADGQVQTLLQVITAAFRDGVDLARAIAKPRWRSEGGELLIEATHPAAAELERLGHRLRHLPVGDTRFGAVVCAGHLDEVPLAIADWRRETACGVA
ncbi:gamma-glutamyltransferase 2. Threonine peptidase. MEROPS family T03 [Burkholderia sp. D7]|nr:gamma-glutamyltransferase 2. Threonine peptidase. MEROPS family T03 [Burkholderia sp. D7]